MPNELGMSFDQCVSRFSGVSSVDDPQAFCGSLEKLIGLGKSMTIKRDAMQVICSPCADIMKRRGLDSVTVGGDDAISYELSKSLHRMGGGFHVKLPIVKQAADGLVTGWAAVITAADGTPLIDFDGDIIPVADLEKAAQEAFTRDSGEGMAGDMHDTPGVADVVESMVITSEKRKALGFGEGPEGWIVTLKIKDQDLLKQIQSGEKTELSIRGRAKRVQVNGTSDDVAVLQGLELSTVELLSVVDAGASGDTDHRPAIVLVKRGIQMPKKETLIERISKLFAKTPSDETIKALEAAIAKQEEGDESEEVKTLDDVVAEMEEEDKAIVMAALASAAKQEGEEEEIEAQEDEEDEEAMKKLPEHIRKQLAETTELRKRVAKMEDQKLLDDCVAKARSLSYLQGDATELGELLKAAKSLPADQQKKLDRILSAANAAIEKSALFSESGTKRPAPDSAAARLDAEVAKLAESDPELKKMGAKVAKAKALTMINKRDPDLVRAAREENH